LVLWSYFPVPARAIDAAKRAGVESLWTNANNIVVNGPFTLARWQPNDYVVLRRNPRYYASSCVRLEEICFLPTRDEHTMLSLYKAGQSHASPGRFLSPQALAGLRQVRDLKREPAARIAFYSIDSQHPPFENVLVRYSLNMALDKQAIAAYLAGGQSPAAGFVPPMQMFAPLINLPVTVDGQTYDVVSSDPKGARTLLAKAGYPGGVDKRGNRVSFKLTIGQRPRSLKTAEILQAQWRQRLGIEITIGSVTESVWSEILNRQQYDGMVEDAWMANYLDPHDFLGALASPGSTGATWMSAAFDQELERANATPDAGERLHKLAESERTLMLAMPVVPLYFDSFSFLQKPFVRGLWNNPADVPLFKYASIDTQWRPS
jgi:oligopeptide transport system substrate-binding protein